MSQNIHDMYNDVQYNPNEEESWSQMGGEPRGGGMPRWGVVTLLMFFLF